MLFPMIRIKEKGIKEKGVLVGADPAHHTLIIDKNGSIKFFNIQSHDGTGP